MHLFYEQKSTEVKNHPLKDPLCNQNQACLCNISNPGIVSLPFDVPSWELSVWFPADSSRFGVLTIGNTGIQELSVGENHIGDLAATYLAEAFGEAVSRCQVSKSLILPRRGLYLRYSAKKHSFSFSNSIHSGFCRHSKTSSLSDLPLLILCAPC